MTMQCPACRWRLHHIVATDCPVCTGTGTLTLGAAATSYYTPAVVAAAITYSLEARAREIDHDTTRDDDQAGLLSAHVALLHDGGLIGNRARPPYGPRTPHALAEAAGQTPVTDLDATLADADPYVYAAHERPTIRGVPPLSDNGHPSALARLTDPAGLFTDQRERAWGRPLDEYRIATLVAAGISAAHHTHDKRNRRRTAA